MLKNLRNILPLPRGWKDDELRFGTRLNDAVTELLKNVRRLMALIAPESRQVVSTDMLLTDAQKRAAVENLGASKWIWLAPADNTWAAIWAKLSWINPGDVVPIYVAGAAMNVLSDGAMTAGYSGTVGCSGGNYYFSLVSSSSSVKHVTMLVTATEAGVTRVVVNSTTDRIETLETDLDTLSDKLRVTTYSSVTDLNLASGATLAEIYSAMTYPSIGLFQANEVSSSDLPTSSSGGYIRIEKSTGARSRIFYYHKTDTTLDAEMPINSNNVPSGNWDMSNRSDVQTLRDDVDGLLDSALVKTAQTLTDAEQTQVRTNLGLGTASTKAVANNVATTAAGSVLDARQGKTLDEKIDTLRDQSWSYGAPTVIPDGTDLDTITTVGNYYAPASANAQTMPNAPLTNTGFILRVERGVSASYRTQICYGVQGASFSIRRLSTGGTATPWRTYALTTAVTALQEELETGSALTPTMAEGVTATILEASHVGAVVFVRLTGITADAPTNGWNTICTLPSGYRPEKYVYFVVYYGTNRPATCLDGRLTGAGSLQIYGLKTAVDAGATVNGTLTFIAGT